MKREWQMTIGIVGLGAMGLGIAQVYAQAGHPVRVTDAIPDVRASAMTRLAAALAPPKPSPIRSVHGPTPSPLISATSASALMAGC